MYIYMYKRTHTHIYIYMYIQVHVRDKPLQKNSETLRHVRMRQRFKLELETGLWMLTDFRAPWA